MSELLRKVTAAPVGLLREIHHAVQERRASKENEKYGTPQERLAAYEVLHDVNKYLFIKFASKTGVVRATNKRRLVFDIPDIGVGILDECNIPGGTYRLHTISTPVIEKYGGHFTESRQKQAVLETDGVEATIREGNQGERYSDNWSPKDGGGYWESFNKLGKPKPLDAFTAEAWAMELITLPPGAIHSND